MKFDPRELAAALAPAVLLALIGLVVTGLFAATLDVTERAAAVGLGAAVGRVRRMGATRLLALGGRTGTLGRRGRRVAGH